MKQIQILHCKKLFLCHYTYIKIIFYNLMFLTVFYCKNPVKNGNVPVHGVPVKYQLSHKITVHVFL